MRREFCKKVNSITEEEWYDVENGDYVIDILLPQYNNNGRYSKNRAH
jgi:hypothetical protein